jgi:hypothetical protein
MRQFVFRKCHLALLFTLEGVTAEVWRWACNPLALDAFALTNIPRGSCARSAPPVWFLLDSSGPPHTYLPAFPFYPGKPTLIHQGRLCLTITFYLALLWFWSQLKICFAFVSVLTNKLHNEGPCVSCEFASSVQQWAWLAWSSHLKRFCLMLIKSRRQGWEDTSGL